MLQFNGEWYMNKRFWYTDFIDNVIISDFWTDIQFAEENGKTHTANFATELVYLTFFTAWNRYDNVLTVSFHYQ